MTFLYDGNHEMKKICDDLVLHSPKGGYQTKDKMTKEIG